MYIGIISDTHGLLRPEVVKAFKGVSAILHAGDIGSLRVLEGLKGIAPVTVVRGNVDNESWERKTPLSQAVRFGEINIYMIHDIEDLKIDPKAAGFQVVVYGHSHLVKVETRKDVLYINPGSAGQKRFKLPVTLVVLEISGKNLKAKIIDLEKSDFGELEGVR
jgi:putative phosphoesterase